MHPVPVILPIIEDPLRIAIARFESATISIAPVIAMTAPVFSARALAKAALSARFSSVTASSGFASTPRVVAAAPARAFISDMLPRITLTS